MNLELVMQMAHSPVKNYAIPGLTSWLISENENGIIRLFEMTRDHVEFITPHSHRFDFTCVVLEGEVENIVYQPNAIFEGGDQYRVTISRYLGAIGKYQNSPITVNSWFKLSSTKYGIGEQYSMKADEIHSIRFKKGTKVLFFEGNPYRGSSVILEPVVDGEVIENFKVEPWMFKKENNKNGN